MRNIKVSAQIIDEEPNFFAFAEGEKEGVSINLTLYRLEGEVFGFRKVIENGQRTFLTVRGAALCTDGRLQNPILQTDAEQPIAIWTPTCVDVEVKPTAVRVTCGSTRKCPLRFAVLWRKRSNGTDRAKDNRWVERSLSLRHTCRQLGQSTYAVLVEVLTSWFHGRQPNLAWLY